MPDWNWACPRCGQVYVEADCPCLRCDWPDSLTALHEARYSAIEGAHVRVRQEKDENDPMAPASEWSGDNIRHEEREGELVGRAEGRGIWYDSARGENVPNHIGPTVFLETPEDTVLEVRTDKDGNKLLAFEPPENDE